jgi:hypothetical protein
VIELNNITFIEYFELEDKSEYDYAIRYAYRYNQPENLIEIPDLIEMTFGFVKDLQYDCAQGLTWEKFFEYLNLIKKDKYEKWKLVNLCQLRAYLLSEIDRINEIESETLSHDLTADEVNAGIESLAELGIYLQIRSLTGGDITKNESIRNMKYEDCFLELITQKRLDDYSRALIKIQKSNLSRSNN